MLQMKNVGFDGAAGKKTVHVLSRVNLSLPPRGRVLVTGPSGSGKTALLRLISGREVPSRGEIVLNGENTSRWNDARRSAWRRRCAAASEDLLLPDRTLLQNAELSLRLAGWRGRELRSRAEEALSLLGLKELGHSLPDELSGEERRLGALCCAMAREPEVLLADEPLDGLEEETAARVQSLLRAAGEERLVVIASRDAELFFGESIQVITLDKGMVESDTGEGAAYPPLASAPPAGLAGGGRASMALGNLRRKNAHTPVRLLVPFLAVLALGVILAALGGAERTERSLQAETLAGYPITLTGENVASGDVEALADWLQSRMDGRSLSLQRSYAIQPWIFTYTTSDGARRISPVPGTDVNLWRELPDGDSLLQARYRLVSGRWPVAYDEAVVILNDQGVLDGACLSALGISAEEALRGLTYPELLRLSFRVILPTEEYVRNVDGTWGFMGGDSEYMAALAGRSLSLKIVGILEPGTDLAGDTGVGGAAYTAELTRWVVSSILDSEIVRNQLSDPERDVVSGLPFDTAGVRTADLAARRATLQRRATTLTAAEQAEMYYELTGQTVEETAAQDTLLRHFETMPEEELDQLYEQLIASGAAVSSLEDNLRSFGATAAETVTAVRIYANSFAARVNALSMLRSYSEPVTYEDEASGIIAAGAKVMGAAAGIYPLVRVLAAVLAAAAVILSAALPVLARRREMAVLRCRGLSSGAAAGILTWESLLLGLTGSLAGALLALVLSTLFSSAIPGVELALDWRLAAILAGAGTVCAALTGRLTAGAVTGDSPGESLRKLSA